MDVETGGLNPRNDPLLSIGAVEIRNGQINLGAGQEQNVVYRILKTITDLIIRLMRVTNGLQCRFRLDETSQKRFNCSPDRPRRSFFLS